MSSFQGFWSYVHKDDEAEKGKISQLARDVVDQYELLTGESIELFLDKDSLQWGDKWRDKIDETLSSIVFFIPIMTPRYFMSSECRREFQFFARRAESLGIKDLVLPLLYVDVPSFGDENPQDDLICLARQFQWQDWRDLRLADSNGEAYRRNVSLLSSRLVAANQRAEIQNNKSTVHQEPVEAILAADAELGVMDRLANAEEALPGWQETLVAITGEIENIGRVMQESTMHIKESSDHKGTSFAFRLNVVRRLAHKLDEPTAKLFALSNRYTSQLHDVDDGFRLMIERALVEIKENPESKKELCQFFEMIKELEISAREGLDAVHDMIDIIAPIEKMSRDLRPVLRRLRQGLTVMVEARSVMESWVDLINSSDIQC
jgi:hypothetical protein